MVWERLYPVARQEIRSIRNGVAGGPVDDPRFVGMSPEEFNYLGLDLRLSLHLIIEVRTVE